MLCPVLFFSLVALIPSTLAGFDPGSKKNIAVYWGQNAIGPSGPPQTFLLDYCRNSKNINVIPLAFVIGIHPEVEINFANIPVTTVGEDIKRCQKDHNKTIILSLGGDQYKKNWTSPCKAEKSAETVWAMFGPEKSGSLVHRPFGDASVDGFDFDFEYNITYLDKFGAKLRELMNNATAKSGRKFYLTAAPQCPRHGCMDSTLNAVAFDFIMVQFYNNPCGVSDSENFKSSFNDWDTWANSKTPNVKVMVGILGSNMTTDSGYICAEELKHRIWDVKKYTSFSGVMIWDMSRVCANDDYLGKVVKILDDKVVEAPDEFTFGELR